MNYDNFSLPNRVDNDTKEEEPVAPSVTKKRFKGQSKEEVAAKRLAEKESQKDWF